MSFVALAGQDKVILTVSRGASHFNFNFLNCFLIHSNSKMTAKKLFFIGRLAHTFAAVSR